MLALEDELAQQVLEVGSVEFAIELLVDGAVLDAARGGLVGVVVEPCLLYTSNIDGRCLCS